MSRECHSLFHEHELRDGILSFLQSLTTCWNIVVNDYGIIPTMAAATTLASLVLLGFVLYRISSPKPKNNAAPSQKKKKRKPHKGGRGGRIKGRKQHVEPKRLSTERVEEEEKVAATDIVCEGEISHIPCQRTDFLPTELTQEPTRPRVLTADTAPMDDQSFESTSIRSTSSAPSPACAKALEEGRKTTSTPNRQRGNADFLPKELMMQEPTRPRVLTADTALTDDPFVESASVQSTASAPSPACAKTLEKGRKPTRTPNRRRGNAKRGKKAKSFDTSDENPPNKSHRSHQFGNPNGQPPSERPLDASTGEPLFLTPSSSSSPSPNVHPPRAAAVSQTSSLFSHEPIASSNLNTPTMSYPSHGVVHGMNNASFNAPNYATYYSRAHVAHGKIELAAFLAQVGLVGTVCSDLLEDLDDVDALSRLSDAQFELYNVTPDKMARINWMLAARDGYGGCSATSYSSAHPAAPIRPPPGLAAKNSDDPLRLSPPRLNQSVGHDDARELNFGYRSDGGFGQSLGRSKQLQLPSLLQSYNVSNNSLCDEEDQIEAELQELGGQMVGSILDFEA